jgi:GDP-4-dehydro-6-deoxy-D-mannose reductase
VSASRILITGVGGFVGNHLARRIVEQGRVALGLGVEPAPPAIRDLLLDEWCVDVRDPKALTEVLTAARPDAIVHLAGQSSAALSFEQPVETYRVNTLGTWNLLEAARLAVPGARVLVVGTSEVYGPQPVGTRVREDAPFHPVSPYALSKAAADAGAEAFSRRFGLDVVRTRSFAHIGPGQTDRFVVPSVARQIAEIEAGRRESVIRVGNLDVTRDLTDVRDVVDAYLALLERGRRGAAYNVCRGEGMALTAVVSMLCERARVTVRIEVDHARVRPADVPFLVGDPSLLVRDTAWRPTVPLDRTLGDVLEEWRTCAGMS